MSFRERELCKLFLNNPNKNPQTGNKLTPYRGSYNQYINLSVENGFEEEVGVMLLTSSKQEQQSKYFVQQELPTKEEIIKAYNSSFDDKWGFEEMNYREYKRPKHC